MTLGDTMKSARLLMFVAWSATLYGQTAPSVTGVVNSASFDNRLSPGALASVYGTNLGTSTSTSVTVGGKAAAVLFASAGQFSIQIPFDAPTGATSIQVANSAPFNVTLSAYAPGLFTASQTGTGLASASHSDGTPVTTTSPAALGETVSFFANGLGPTNPAVATGVAAPASPQAATLVQPTVTIGGQAALVKSAFLAPGQVGVYQVNVQLPASGVANGTPSVVLMIGGSASNTVTLAVGQPVVNPIPVIGGVISATGIPGSVQNNIESGSWVAIYGTNLADSTMDWTGKIVNGILPTTLGGVSVTIGGKAAAVYYISPGQLDVQASDGLSGSVPVVVTNNGRISGPGTAQAQDYAPALFQWGSFKYAVATRYPDNAYIGGLNFGSPYQNAKAGDVLILWATGFGPTNPAAAAGTVVGAAGYTTTPVTATLGGNPISVLATALSPGLAGVYQIAVEIPNDAPSGDLLIRATIQGNQTPDNVYLYIAPQ
jgi:uncharacterized protein (TIGR03437 family)